MLTSSLQTDPHGSLLWLDFLAIKANEFDWLEQIADTLDVSYLPGFAYNKALGMRIRNQGKVCILDCHRELPLRPMLPIRRRKTAIKLCKKLF